MDKILDEKTLSSFNKSFLKDKKNKILMNAVVKNGIYQTSENQERVINTPLAFSSIVNSCMITNQKQSGRCWLFAASNILRFQAIKKLNLNDFEISQSYLFFYDKLEKANFFLESILKTLKESNGSRLLSFLLSTPIQDGGQWDMVVNIVKKYGVVPKDIYPESYSSSKSIELNSVLSTKLREYAAILRRESYKGAKIADLRNMKEKMLDSIYRILVISLGSPVKKFSFSTMDKNNKIINIENITPIDFYKHYVGLDLDDYIPIINSPTSDKPFNKSYTVKYLGNVFEGKQVKYLNTPISTLKRVTIKQLEDGEAVWFGADISKCASRSNGVLSKDIYDINSLFSLTSTLDKATRLDYLDSCMNHAMTFTGVNVNKGVADRFRVDNSWGVENGRSGHYIMDSNWFDEFVYQVVVKRKYLTDEEYKAYLLKPIELEPWDPMGSLALVK